MKYDRKLILNSLYGENITEKVIDVKSKIKDYMNSIVFDLALNNNLSYSKFEENPFEVGQLCACIDILNKICNCNYTVTINPNLTFYKNGKRIVINDI